MDIACTTYTFFLISRSSDANFTLPPSQYAICAVLDFSTVVLGRSEDGRWCGTTTSMHGSYHTGVRKNKKICNCIKKSFLNACCIFSLRTMFQIGGGHGWESIRWAHIYAKNGMIAVTKISTAVAVPLSACARRPRFPLFGTPGKREGGEPRPEFYLQDHRYMGNKKRRHFK